MDSCAQDRLIHQIYEGAFDDGAWQHTINSLSGEAFNSAIAFDHNSNIGGVDACVACCEIDDDVRDLATQHFNTPELNPGIAAVLHSTIGRPFLLESFVNVRMLEEHDGVKFFFGPHDFDKGLFVTIDRNDTELTFMSLFRRSGRAPYTAQDMALLAKLSPHISTAFRLRDLRQSTERRDAVLHKLDRDNNALTGVVVVDRSFRIIEADGAAHARLEKAAGLCRHGRQIASTSSHPERDTSALHSFIARAGSDTAPFVIDCLDTELLRLQVVPIAADMDARVSTGSTAIVIDVIRRTAPIDFVSFAAVYDLTPAEIRLVEALAGSRSASEAASRIGIKHNTAKTHLSHIFMKTGVKSQTQLMLTLGRFT